MLSLPGVTAVAGSANTLNAGGAPSTAGGKSGAAAGRGDVTPDSVDGGSSSSNRAGSGSTLNGGSSSGGMPETGGEAGSEATTRCEDAPIPLKGSWLASASHSSLGTGEYDNPPQNVMDLSDKRWSTGKPQAGDEWLQIDFGAPAAIRELTFTLNPDDAEDYPRIYQLEISDKPLDFSGSIRASGAGQFGQTLVVTLAEPVVGRYLLVLQKGKDPVSWWSVSELGATCF